MRGHSPIVAECEVEEAMVQPGEETPPASSMSSDLAYLLLFSEALLDLVSDAVVVVDDRGRIRTSNEAFAARTGRSRDELLSSDFTELPFFGTTVTSHGSRPLSEVLLGSLDSGARVLVPDLPWPGASERVSVRAAPWDTEDPAYRRVLIGLRAEESEPTGDAADAEVVWGPSGWVQAIPIGLGWVDAEDRLRRFNERFATNLGVTLRAFDPVSKAFDASHVPHVEALLNEARSTGRTARGSLGSGATSTDPIKVWNLSVRPLARVPGDPEEFLLLLEEGVGMSSSVRSDLPTIPTAPNEILASTNLERWPSESSGSVLIVDADAWMRMVLSDALRGKMDQEPMLAESGVDAFDKYDLRSFRLIVVGLDGDRDDAIRFCQRIHQELPGQRVLVVTDTPLNQARSALEGVAVLGLMGGPFQKDSFRDVVLAVAESGGNGMASPGQDFEDPQGEPARDLRVILLGASESDQEIFSALYTASGVNIQMVYDPDSESPGLLMAQQMKIPVVSGRASIRLESRPDAVVLAREGMEEYLSSLHLKDVPRIRRDEMRLFLGDPHAFLESARESDEADSVPPALSSAIDPPEETPAPPPPPSAAAPVEPPAARPAKYIPPPPGLDDVPTMARGPKDSPDAPAAPAEPPASPAASETPTPTPPPAWSPPPVPSEPSPPASSPVSSPAPEAARASSEEVAPEFDSVLGAFDLFLDFDRFARYTLDSALKATGATSGCLLWVDRAKHSFECVARRQVPVEELADVTPLGDGVAGQVAETGEAKLLSPGVGADPSGARPLSWETWSLWSPLTVDHEVIAVLNVNADPSTKTLGENDLATIGRLGAHVAPALARCRGGDTPAPVRRRDPLRDELAEVAREGRSLDERLSRISDHVAKLLSAESCSIFLFDGDRRDLSLRATSGISLREPDSITIPLGKSLAGHVAENLRPAVLSSPPGEAAAAVPSVVGVPLRFRTGLSGVIVLETAAPFVWDDEKSATFKSIASAVGSEVGVRWSRQGREVVGPADEFADLGQALAAVTDRGSFGRLATISIAGAVSFDVFTLRLATAGSAASLATSEIVSVRGVPEDDPLGALHHLESYVAERVFQAKSEIRTDSLTDASGRQLLDMANVANVMAQPLMDGDNVVGVATAYRVQDGDSPGEFADKDLDTTRRWAGHIGAASRRLTR